jgi:hypothetical protein
MPSDILKFLLVNGYVAVNDLYQPYHVNVTGIATFSMLAGNLIEINVTYNSAYDVPIVLPYVGNDSPISIEMPLPNGSIFRTTLSAYDGAVYAPHLYTWYFDGVDDYILLPNIPLDGDFSLQVLLYDLAPTVGRLNIFSWFYDNSNFFGLTHKDLGDGITLALKFQGTTYDLYDIKPIPTSWLDLAGVFSASRGLKKIYRNASLSSQGAFTPFTQPVLTPVYVSLGRSVTGGYYFNGYIARVLLYTRIIDANDIAWNYQYPDNPVKNGLVLWLQADPQYVYDIDGDGVLEWIDLSGYGNHGKIYGAQLVQLVKTPARVLIPARVLSSAR